MIRKTTLHRSLGTVLAAAALFGAWGMTPASAEPIFLSKQYPRCTACHYSPSGGGLLTPYGRSLSREEISTFGRRSAAGGAPPGESRSEESFLFGALGNDFPLQLGLDLRPSHVGVTVPGIEIDDRNFLMNLDLQAAWQRERWTAYGSIGRKPTRGGELVSYEHWVAYQVSDALSVRGGRFLPAYGVRFADHTSFSREGPELAQDDQVYGVEVGVSLDRSLLQLSAGPGRADSAHRRQRPGSIHRERPVPVRPQPAHGRRGVAPVPRRDGLRSPKHPHRRVLRIRPGALAGYLDPRRPPPPEAGPERSVVHRRQPDLGGSVAGALAESVAAGALDRQGPLGGKCAAWCTAWTSIRGPTGT